MPSVEDILKKVRALEIKSKKLTNHLFTGEYHTAFKGRGMSFKEVREYQAGDDIRFIDWNVSARMGHPYSKLFEEERELSVYLLVDLSASSLFGTFRQNKKDLIHFTDDEISKSAALNFQNLVKNDSITLLKKQLVVKDNHEISFYFYQIQRKNDETKSVKKQLYTIAFLNENKKINPLAYTTAPIKTISIEEDPEKTYALIINEILNGDHMRASFEKEKDEEELSLGEEY